MYVKRNTTVRSRNHCCYGNEHVDINNRTAGRCHANARMHSLRILVELHNTGVHPYSVTQYPRFQLPWFTEARKKIGKLKK
jgi:hypothetical protein